MVSFYKPPILSTFIFTMLCSFKSIFSPLLNHVNYNTSTIERKYYSLSLKYLRINSVKLVKTQVRRLVVHYAYY